MPVIIENISPHDLPDNVEHDYRLRINGTVIATFRHVRNAGLSECLRQAANAADASTAEWVKAQTREQES